ncbi:MAG: hypothetical protein KAR45_15520 [Desulfobacteraceae bacterium]|nr:hypothetical protein [Desulfobacteraceae bacterium]
MFESITFFTQNRTNASSPLDIGALVECMLFYGKTSIVANQGILKQLLSYFGIERAIELINEDLLQIIYTENGAGIHTSTTNGIQYHDVILYSSPQHTYEIEIRKICTEITGKSGKGRRSAKRIHDLVEVKNHEEIILEGARKSILDQEYINDSAKSILQSLIPEKIDVSGVEFYTKKTEKGIIAASNIDFTGINQIYHKYVPHSHSSITLALILSHTLQTESELYFSSNNLSEMATSKLSANLISHKVNYLLEKSFKSAKKISDFQEFVIGDAKSLRETVNSRKIDLDELLEVLKNSQRFKKWIIGVDPDQDLIKNYYAEVTKKTAVDKLPGKSVRWFIFTGAGLIADAIATGGIGTAVGIGLGALDTLYLDKLISGWKPNQFIEEDVKRLLTKST